MRVLITGIAGYVASHVALAMEDAGYTVIGYDDLSTGQADVAARWPLERGDVRDARRLGETFAKHKPEAVMHFAAKALVDESVREPLMYWDVNLGGTLRLLEAMRAHDVRSLVFSSTCAVYGTPPSVPITEDMPKRPETPYGASKLAAERLITENAQAGGARAFLLRYFNAAGADPQGRAGFTPHDPHLVPRCARAALLGEPMRLFGDDWQTRDGTCERDYIHVADLAKAHMLACEFLKDTKSGFAEALNLGTGEGATNREVLAETERAGERPIAVKIEGRREGDPAALVADPSRARAMLGFTPTRSGLQAICADSINWARAAHKTQ